jgi:hypothetical protein
MSNLDDAPQELRDSIREFWPESEWENAASISLLESGWNAFALNDTTDFEHPCGSVIDVRDGVTITAERSVGWFQINGCNLPPDWNWHHLYNTRHNCGTAHQLWAERGWYPWFFSATKLGLIG